MSGGKRGRHTSRSKDLRPAVGWMESLHEVERIVIGLTENCRHRFRPGTIRVRRVHPHGLDLNGYTGSGVTRLFVAIAGPTRDAFVALLAEKYGAE